MREPRNPQLATRTRMAEIRRLCRGRTSRPPRDETAGFRFLARLAASLLEQPAEGWVAEAQVEHLLELGEGHVDLLEEAGAAEHRERERVGRGNQRPEAQLGESEP